MNNLTYTKTVTTQDIYGKDFDFDKIEFAKSYDIIGFDDPYTYGGNFFWLTTCNQIRDQESVISLNGPRLLLQKKKWIPKNEEIIWTITINPFISKIESLKLLRCNYQFNINKFKTETDCENARIAIMNLLKEIHEKLGY